MRAGEVITNIWRPQVARGVRRLDTEASSKEIIGLALKVRLPCELSQNSFLI